MSGDRVSFKVRQKIEDKETLVKIDHGYIWGFGGGD